MPGPRPAQIRAGHLGHRPEDSLIYAGLPTPAETSSVIALIAATISRRWSSKYSTLMKRLAANKKLLMGAKTHNRLAFRLTRETRSSVRPPW